MSGWNHDGRVYDIGQEGQPTPFTEADKVERHIADGDYRFENASASAKQHGELGQKQAGKQNAKGITRQVHLVGTKNYWLVKRY